MTAIEDWKERLVVLKQMLEDLSARLGYVGECDDCNTDRTHVIIDPDTADIGNFDMCEKCIRKRVSAVSARIKRMKDEVKSHG